MEGSYYLCIALEKICHLQASLSSQASVDCITSKRHTRHLQVTDNFEGKKNIFHWLEKSFSHLRKKCHRKALHAKEAQNKKSGEKAVLIMRPLRREEDKNARKTKIFYNLEWV